MVNIESQNHRKFAIFSSGLNYLRKSCFFNGSSVFNWTAYIYNFRILYQEEIGTTGFKEPFLKNKSRTGNCKFSVILCYHLYKILEFYRNIL